MNRVHERVTEGLRRMWRRAHILQEVAKSPKDLPQGAYVMIQPVSGMVIISYTDPEGQDLVQWKKHPVYGSISIEPGSNRCEGAWGVTGSSARKGWGPLLYDVAIEWATLNGAGLMSDRAMVSKLARAVWQKYLTARPDVDAEELPDVCSPLLDPDEEKAEEALMYRYSKQPTMISKLRGMGKLIES